MIHLMRWDLISYAIIYRCTGNWSRTSIRAHWRWSWGSIDLCRPRGTTSSCHLVQGNNSNRYYRTTFTTGTLFNVCVCLWIFSNAIVWFSRLSNILEPKLLNKMLTTFDNPTLQRRIWSQIVKCEGILFVSNATNHIHQNVFAFQFIVKSFIFKHLSNWFTQSRGNRHTLTIRNVTYNDLGNYTCQASNNLGKDRASLTLSGIPSVCTFDSVSIFNWFWPIIHISNS